MSHCVVVRQLSGIFTTVLYRGTNLWPTKRSLLWFLIPLIGLTENQTFQQLQGSMTASHRREPVYILFDQCVPHMLNKTFFIAVTLMLLKLYINMGRKWLPHYYNLQGMQTFHSWCAALTIDE